MVRRLAAVLGPLSLLVAAACGGDGASPADDSSAGVSAVAAVYPLAWMAEQIAPEADVALLGAGGLEAHDLEITSGQRAAMEAADVVLFVGHIGYQPQVEEAAAAVDAEIVSLAEVAGPERLIEGGADPHAGEGANEGGAEHAEDEGASVDAHIWFDPEVMADAAVRTGEAFAAADPDSAGTYRANAEDLRGELDELGDRLDGMLGGECRHDEAIVSHQAYGYLLEPYGLAQHAVTGINPEAGASSGELAELVEEVRREGLGHVLAEPVEGRDGAEAVAREAGVELLEISPLDAVTEAQAGEGFVTLVLQQAERFATALGC